ncbi:hypothetical protein QVD17_27131 [Tagetes erecta]|uniref:Inner centromere protein ARK-binding domain-containing protein n=1 Tax=Tagetes erecta TaxID=13708 RepID=A0AAD8K7V8_TARER|nr:hypothetical protein QVD17_27131 [Tagetes erecta]
MTTLEKLIIQMFDRTDSAIELLQQQADSYTQQLATTFLIDGITPPSWLLSPSSQSSDPNELGKEEIISKILLRPPRDSTRYSTGVRSLYYRPGVAGGSVINKTLSTEMSMETHAPNKAINLSNEPVSRLECQNDGIVGSVDHVPEVDDNAKSPYNETDARITSIYAASDMSLARIHRSKSRQKARELRTNGKATAKSCLSNENRTRISFSGDSKSKKDTDQVTQDKCPSDTSKCNNISGSTCMAKERNGEKGNDRSTSHSRRLEKSNRSSEIPCLENEHNKTGSSFDKEEIDGGIMAEPMGDLLQQSCQGHGVMEGVKLLDVGLGSHAGKKSMPGKTQGKQSQNNIFSGRITRSRSSSQQQTCGTNKPSKLSSSVSCNPKYGGALSHTAGDLKHELSFSNKLSDAVGASQVLSNVNADTEPLCSNGGVLKPVIPSYSDMKESQIGANHQEIAEIVVGNGQIDDPGAMQPVNCGVKLDPVTISMESEGTALRQSSECYMNVKPKHLNFDEIDQCDLNDICSSLSKKRKLDGLLGKECHPLEGSASSTDHKSSCNLFEKQILKANERSSSPETTKAHSYNNIDEIAKYEIKNAGSDLSKDPVVEDAENKSKFSLHDGVDVTCELNLSPKEVDNKFAEEIHSEKSNLNEDQVSSSYMQTKEDDLGHKGKESAAGVYIPVSNNKSSFTSSLTKQGNNDFENCLGKEIKNPYADLDSSKSKEFDVETTNAKMSDIKLNSAKVNTWHLNPQKNVEDQPNCFSDSQKFRVHIHRDAIHCDLETTERGLNLLKESASILSSEKINFTQSDGMQSCDKRVDDEMNYDVSERTESLFEVQAAEVIVTEVDDDTTKITDAVIQSEPSCVLNLIKDAADDSSYSLEADVGPANSTINGDVVMDNNNLELNFSEWVSSYGPVQSSQNVDKTIAVSDEITPVYEGFIIDEEIGKVNLGNNEGGIDFGTLEIPSTTIERASIIEQICKSASIQTPLSQLGSTYKQDQIQGLYGFMEDGILDHMDLGMTVSIDEDSRKHLQISDSGITKIDSIFPEQQKIDYGTPFCWQSKNHYSSPVGKLWERSASSSGSSEIQLSSNPDLTCFPIEEDPSSNEENENTEEMLDEPLEITSPDVGHENPVRASTEMKVERRENDDEVAVEIQEPPVESTGVCIQHPKYPDRYSSNSAGIEVSVPRTRDKVKHKPKVHHGSKVRRYEEENRNSSIATRASSRGNVSVSSNIKNIVRSGIPKMSQKEANHNNIVSNITSFIPFVQQKQAAAVCTGKREIKVKALEAAEAAKRREQERENERKLKKEALKLERARIGKENAKEMEINLKKQQELKKKEAEMAAKKRQREEEERKLLAKKRKLVAESQKSQKFKYEKSRVGKLASGKHVKNAAMAGNKNKSENLRQTKNADENSFQKQYTELSIDKTLASGVLQVTSVPENHDASNVGGEKDKATSVQEMSPVKVISVKLTSLENSYDISPYQCSDDEDDDEDEDLQTKKFVPSWASKTRVAMALPLQKKLDPESIFSIDSFCSMDEVLMPRRLQAQ